MHEGFPTWGALLPESALAVPVSEQERRLVYGSDICRMDDERLFVLARLEIPIVGRTDLFSYLVWVELAAEHHNLWLDLFELERRSHFDPIPGILDTKFPGIENLFGDEVVLCLQDHFHRPKVRSAFVKGPLAELQRKGISFQQACELDHLCSKRCPAPNT